MRIWSLPTLCLLAFLLRCVLIYFSIWFDSISSAKYTDVDYIVFTDAAKYVYENKSPYLRATYRYTPLLALALQVNIFHPAFGKLIFSGADVLLCILLYLTLLETGHSKALARNCSCALLFNPLVFTVSTRGNAESIILLFVVCTLLFHLKRLYVLSGIFYSFAVHLKLYPIIYSLPLWLSLINPAVVVGLLGLRYYDDLPFCFFVQTFAFVMFNKVCTSQYFLWFLGLLPHVVTPANTGMSLKEMLLLSCLWFVAQGLWLTSAYLLEFQGMNTFIYIWLSGLLFLATNTLILTELLKHHI
ncbi:GPI mannosyltransferase 1-like [Zophobas morio]|uniref:GPI mannosyltransferase 1-like n=1 Tax=Zophobas morio TaxID=2755281 RepID=UPI003083DD13